MCYLSSCRRFCRNESTNPGTHRRLETGPRHGRKIKIQKSSSLGCQRIFTLLYYYCFSGKRPGIGAGCRRTDSETTPSEGRSASDGQRTPPQTPLTHHPGSFQVSSDSGVRVDRQQNDSDPSLQRYIQAVPALPFRAGMTRNAVVEEMRPRRLCWPGGFSGQFFLVPSFVGGV